MEIKVEKMEQFPTYPPAYIDASGKLVYGTPLHVSLMGLARRIVEIDITAASADDDNATTTLADGAETGQTDER